MTTTILGLVTVVLAIAMIVVVVGKIRMRVEFADLERRLEAFAPTRKEEGNSGGEQ